MASAPTFDLNSVEHDFASISSSPGSPLLNRTTQGLYAPGSTFKLVTTATALESGIEPTRMFKGGCKVPVQFEEVHNFGDECFGTHDLRYALTHSINTTFAQLGEELGADAIREQMDRFGFGSTPELEDLPPEELRASGLRDQKSGKLLKHDVAIDAARVAIGQERLLVTPLQMVSVAATIANGGIPVAPYLVDKVVERDGKTPYRGKTRELDRAMSATTAATLTDMMKDVVHEGTGIAAQLSGIDVAGKTGTADTPQGKQVWFVGFAPADDPQVAIAVTIEGQPAGSAGGTVAAPIARDVLEAILA
jgi:peptidoglycan glycosyltransferase